MIPRAVHTKDKNSHNQHIKHQISGRILLVLNHRWKMKLFSVTKLIHQPYHQNPCQNHGDFHRIQVEQLCILPPHFRPQACRNHPAYIARRRPKAACPEKNPCKRHRQKSDQASAFHFHSGPASKSLHNRVNPMQQSPCDEINPRSMPHPAYQEDDHGVHALSRHSLPIPA